MAAVKGLNFKVSATAAGLSALSSFTKALGGIRSAGDVAKNSMLGFSSEMNKQARGYDALKALSTSYAAALAQVDRAYRLNAVSGDEWAAATERVEKQFAQAQALFAESPADASSFLGKFTAELEALTAKYNPAAAASQRYDAEVVQLNHALHLGAIDANQYAENIQKIPGSLAQVIAQNERLTFSMKAAAESASVFDNEFNRLQAKFNPAAAEVRRLEGALLELRQAERMGVISAEAYESQMLAVKNQIRDVGQAQRQLVPATNSLGAAIDNHNRAVGSWNRGLKDTNRAIQQAGFQVGDFFIQIAGGQNIMLAFTQQAGQIIQFFGMWGSLAAAAIAVGGALWIMFGKGEDPVKKAEDALKDLNAALSEFGNNSGIALSSIDELRAKYGQFADEVQRAAKALMTVNITQMQDALRAGAVDATVALKQVADAQAYANEIAANPNDQAALNKALYRDQMIEVEKLAGALGMTADLANQLYLAIGNFHNSTGIVEMRDNSDAVLKILEGIYGTSTDIPPEIAKMWTEFGAVNEQVSGYAAALDGTAQKVETNKTKAVGLAMELKNVGDWALQANNQVAGFEPAITRSIGATQGLSGWAEMANANIKGAADEAERLANTNIAAGIAAAAGWAQSLWTRLSGAAAAARDIAAHPEKAAPGTAANLRWQYAQYGMGQSAARDATNPLFNPLVPPDVTGGGGGGGGTSPIEQLRQDYAKLMDDMSPLIASTKQFRDANEAAMAAFDAGNIEGVKSALAEATEIAKEFQSVADSISSAFMSAFSGIIKGTKSVRDGVMDMLESVLDRTVEMLMSPVFDGIAGFLTKSIFGFDAMMPALPSFAGGGHTGAAPRSGGLDGQGGFLAVMHPNETVNDHTRGQGGGAASVTINVNVNGATGNSEIMEMVQAGVSKGLEVYDSKVLPHSMRRVSANPRRF